MSDEECLLCAAEVPHDLWGRRRDYPAPCPYTQAMQDEFDAGKRFEKDTVQRLLKYAPDSEALRLRGIAPYEPKIEVIQSVVSTGCTFDIPSGLCAVHRTPIEEHDAIYSKPEMMTRSEVLARWPNAKLPDA